MYIGSYIYIGLYGLGLLREKKKVQKEDPYKNSCAISVYREGSANNEPRGVG